MKMYLKSPYPCLIKTLTDEVELEEEDILEIEDEDFLQIFPVESDILPFHINLKSPRENASFSIITRDGKKIILLEQPHRIKVSQKQKLSFSNETCEVVVKENLISFETSQRKIEYLCPHKLKNTEILKINDFACVQCEDHLYAYSVKNNTLSHFQGQITLEENKLLLVKDCHDSDGRVRTAKYDFKENIVMESEEFSRNAQKCPKELASYKLLESVRAKDFEYAKNFLSDNLQSQIDEQQIQEFFGSFSTFLPLSTTEFITLSATKKQYVTFSMQDGKIDDISVDVL